MKTTVIESGKINKVDNKAQNGTAGKINNLPVSTSFNAPAKKDETKKDEPANEAAQAITAADSEQGTAKVEPPKAEETTAGRGTKARAKGRADQSGS